MWFVPAAMSKAREPASPIETGTLEPVPAAADPTCPTSLAPQQATLPLVSAAQVCFWPPVTR